MADQTFEVELRIDLNAPNLKGELSRALGDLNQSVTGFDQKIAGVQKGLDGTAVASKKMAQSLSTTRYALYDVSSTLAITGAALVGVAVGTAAVAIAWERDFANVARTSGLVGNALSDLREDFVDLAQTMPTSFGDLTKIGTLGSQLGIAAKDLTSFTQTVVKFSTATGISAEQSAMAFGRLGNILGVASDEYEKLGSSIAFAGLKAVATESEIVAVAQQIGPIARLSGVAADGVIGLATAMASVKIPPELARSVITKTFGDIQKAVETTSPKLAAFGEVAGMSGAEFQKAWKTDATAAFVQLLKGITTNGEGAYAALEKIGITSRRDTPAILKLAQNYELVGQSLANSKKGFEDGSELNRQYGIIAETTAARLQVLAQNFQAFLDAIGQANLGPLGDFVDGLSGLLGWLTDISSTPFGGTILGWTVALTGLIGVLALAGGALALFGASTIGLQQGLAGIVAIGGPAAARILGVGNAAAIASGGMTASATAARLLGAALKAIGLATLILAIPSLADAFNDTMKQMTGAATDAKGQIDELFADGFSDAFVQGLQDWSAGAARAAANLGLAGYDANRRLKDLDETIAEMANGGDIKGATAAWEELSFKWVQSGGNLKALQSYMVDTKGALDTTKAGAESTGTGMDALNGALDAVEAEAQAAQAAINDLRDAVLNFGASTISVEQTQIALSQAFNAMTEAAAAEGAELYGTNDASLRLRESFIGIDKAARDAALAIVENGGSVETATAKYNESREAIIQARVAKGEDAGAAAAWADAILGTSGEAQAAIQAYSDKLNEVPEHTDTDLRNNAPQAKGPVDLYTQSILRIPTYWRTEIVTNYSSTGDVLSRPAPVAGRNYASGGQITGPGTGTSDDIPIWASNGEFMMKAEAVRKYGTAFMQAINSGRMPKFASGGQVGAAASSGMMGGVVELGPKSLSRLSQQAINNIMIDDMAISRAAESGNAKRRASGEL